MGGFAVDELTANHSHALLAEREYSLKTDRERGEVVGFFDERGRFVKLSGKILPIHLAIELCACTGKRSAREYRSDLVFVDRVVGVTENIQPAENRPLEVIGAESSA